MISVLGNIVELSHEDLENFVNSNSYKDQHSNRWTCSLCGQIAANKLDINRHIESKHVKLPELYCDICSKPSKTKNSLRMHMKNYHSSGLI